MHTKFVVKISKECIQKDLAIGVLRAKISLSSAKTLLHNVKEKLPYYKSIRFYDLKKLKGDIIFQMINQNETYIDKNNKNFYINNTNFLYDEIGPFGGPYHLDSARATLYEGTEDIIAMIFSFEGDHYLSKQILSLEKCLSENIQITNVEKDILNETKPEVSLTLPDVRHCAKHLIPHTFCFQADSLANTVHLAGSFNKWLNAVTGRIKTDQTNKPYEMEKLADSKWKLTIDLTPGLHEFKYVINGGKMWKNDPNTLYPGSAGRYNNSILYIEYPPIQSDSKEKSSPISKPEILIEANSLPKSAMSVQKALQEKGYSFIVKQFYESTRTADEAAKTIGCEVSQIVKSLVFCKQKSKAPILVLASGTNLVDEKKVGDVVGEKVKRADANFTREVTGFAIGGIPPMGHKQPIETLIDEDLLKLKELWAAAGTPNAVFSLESENLERLTNGKIANIKK